MLLRMRSLEATHMATTKNTNCQCCNNTRKGNDLAREYGNPALCNACMAEGLLENEHNDTHNGGPVGNACADCRSDAHDLMRYLDESHPYRATPQEPHAAALELDECDVYLLLDALDCLQEKKGYNAANVAAIEAVRARIIGDNE